MHGFAVVRVHAIRIRCRRVAIVVLGEKTGALYAVNNSVETICQSIGLAGCLRGSQLYLDPSLWIQSANGLVVCDNPGIRIVKAVKTGTYSKTVSRGFFKGVFT